MYTGVQKCEAPDLAPDRLLVNTKIRIGARASAPHSPREKELWGGAMEHVEEWDAAGQLLAGEGPQMVSPVLRFRATQGEKLRAIDGIRRSQTNRAAAVRTPENLPARGHFAAAVGYFRKGGTSTSRATAKADRRAACKLRPVTEEDKQVVVVTLLYKRTEKMRGANPRTQLVGAMAAVLRYNTVSRIRSIHRGRMVAGSFAWASLMIL